MNRAESPLAGGAAGATSLERAVGAMAVLGSGAAAGLGVALFIGLPLAVAHATVLAHVLLGLVTTPALLLYLVLHARRTWERDAGASRVVSVLSSIALVTTLASGCALVALYASGSAPASVMRGLHAVLGVAIVMLVPLHILGAGGRLRAPGGVASTLAWTVATILLGGIAVVGTRAALPESVRVAAVPDGYPLSPDGSLFGAAFTETAHGGLVPAAALTASADCAGCHAEIAAEWAVSAHRFSGVDNPLIATATRPAEEKGGLPAARFCAACHEPVALLSGHVTTSAFDAPQAVRGQGVNCLVCHGIQDVPSLRGNGEMVFGLPDAFPLFDAEGPALARFANRILVASAAEAHRAAMRPALMSNSQQCASCHTVNAHEGLNDFGFVRLHNENDDWRISAFAKGVGPDQRVVRCQDCHMGLVSGSSDPVSDRRGGAHRSHRFLAANTFVAAHLGDAEQLRLTERFLRGEGVPDEIRSLVPEGPVVSLTLESPESVAAGGSLEVAAVLWNRGVGHAFPAGPNEVNEAWVELVVSDAEGRELLASGRLSPDGERDPDAFALISVPVDAEGREIFVTGGLASGFRFRRAILHGESDRETYQLAVPAELAGQELQVRARLRYRKADAPFARLLPGFEPGDVPVTDLAEAETRVRVTRPAG